MFKTSKKIAFAAYHTQLYHGREIALLLLIIIVIYNSILLTSSR